MGFMAGLEALWGARRAPCWILCLCHYNITANPARQLNPLLVDGSPAGSSSLLLIIPTAVILLVQAPRIERALYEGTANAS